MNLLDHCRQRLDAFILHRVPFRPALRRELARYFITEEQALVDLMDAGRQQPGSAHLRTFDAALALHGGQLSFSQTGEDLIVDYIFRALGIAHPSYLDLGAFDPWSLSNTARLHLRGSRGVNVEPNPAQFARFVQSRPDDQNVNVGIAAAAGTLTYFELDVPTLNTFSRAEAERCVREEGHRILRETPVPVLTLPEVLDSRCHGQFPDFLSVDIEGLDRLVVEVIAGHAVKPKVVCIETLSYSRSGQGQKDEALVEALHACGYLRFADTHINTIFVLEQLWRGTAGGTACADHDAQAPTVSVVLPVYNGEAYLRDAVDSILTQTYRKLELLLVDDFSTDSSRRIAEEYAQRDARVRVLPNTREKGLAGAVNSGLAAATGKYIARMDGDDLSAPQRLMKQVTFMEQHPEVGLCGTWFRFMHTQEVVQHPQAHDDIRIKLLGNTAFAHPSVMLRKSVLTQHDLHYDRAYEPADDYHLWVRMAQLTRLANIPEVLLEYREHAGQTSHSSAQVQATHTNSIRLMQARALGLALTPAEEALYLALVTRAQLDPSQRPAAHQLVERVLAAARTQGAYALPKLKAFFDQALTARPAPPPGPWRRLVTRLLQVLHG